MRERKYELLQAAAVLYAADKFTRDGAVNTAYDLLHLIEARERASFTQVGKEPDVKKD